VKRRKRYKDQFLAERHLREPNERICIFRPHAKTFRFGFDKDRVGFVDGEEGDVVVVEYVLGAFEAVVSADVLVHGAHGHRVKPVTAYDI